ncbi:MAG: hypothetical protein HON81_05350 [Verrucomicrobia bacterium]|jgi:hypothetical protein|nr:hypothetical protein [Verrucomicrobiota bacterium]
MNVISGTVLLSPWRIRGLSIALFTVISAALWIGFSADTYFASDGPFYFAIILDNATFTHVSPSRAHAEYLTQWPLVLAVRSGVTDLKALEIFFGLGVWFPWILSFAISLYATRERPALIFFFLISMVSLNLSSWCLIYGEHLTLLLLVWPIFYFGIMRRRLTFLEQLLTALLLVAHLKLYETALVSGVIFTFIFTFRSWLEKNPRERWGSGVLASLALASVVIAVTWIIFPRDLENRGHFLGAIVASLAHPYPWIGLSYVTLNMVGIMFSSSRLRLAAWIVPLVIGGISLLSPGIMGGISFSTRTLTLTALPFLMLITFLFSLSRLKLTKDLAVSVSLIVVGLSLLYIRHLQSWVTFKGEFQGILKEEKGFVDPADHGDIDHWGWTNPLLSYVWAEGQVKSVILNRNFEDGYEPFDPFTEMVMEKYLDEKPSFLREKKEE